MLRKLNNARPNVVLAVLYGIAIPYIYSQMGINGIYFLVFVTVTFLVFNKLDGRKRWS